MKLLNIDANAKTVKGQKQGYMTAVLYLAPADVSGFNVCPMAEVAGCIAGCLNTAGRGGMSKGNAKMSTESGRVIADNAIQHARIARTRLFYNDREAFFSQLIAEIKAFIRKAEKAGLIPAIRLNGTSDLPWHSYLVSYMGLYRENIMKVFPNVQFYDYTKVVSRTLKPLPSNYHLTLSYSEASNAYKQQVLTAVALNPQLNIAVVFRGKNHPSTFAGMPVLNGDESDLRFTDKAGHVVALYAKGSARKDTSGFVVDTH